MPRGGTAGTLLRRKRVSATTTHGRGRHTARPPVARERDAASRSPHVDPAHRRHGDERQSAEPHTPCSRCDDPCARRRACRPIAQGAPDLLFATAIAFVAFVAFSVDAVIGFAIPVTPPRCDAERSMPQPSSSNAATSRGRRAAIGNGAGLRGVGRRGRPECLARCRSDAGRRCRACEHRCVRRELRGCPTTTASQPPASPATAPAAAAARACSTGSSLKIRRMI